MDPIEITAQAGVGEMEGKEREGELDCWIADRIYLWSHQPKTKGQTEHCKRLGFGLY